MDPSYIPVVVLFSVFGLFYLGIRAHQARMMHQERLAAIDKGVDIKPILLSATPAFGHRVYLLRGLIWLFAGAALAGTLAVATPLFRTSARPLGQALEERLVRIQVLKNLGATQEQIATLEKQHSSPAHEPPPNLTIIGIIPMSVGIAYLMFYGLEEKRVRHLPPA